MRIKTLKRMISLFLFSSLVIPYAAEAGNKLVLIAYPSEIMAGEWTTKYTIQRQDESGNPVTEGKTKVVPLTSSDSAKKAFSIIQGFPPPLPPGAEGFTSTIHEGKSTVDFYYYDEKAGDWTISFSAEGLSGNSINLTVHPTEATSISAVAGNDQIGTVGATLSNFFVVRVTDDYGNGAKGKTVSWSITETPSSVTGQSLSTQMMISASDGEARTMLTLGDQSGTYRVQALYDLLPESPIVFNATASPEGLKNISLVSGSCQSGEVNSSLTQPFVVEVTDASGNPVQGATVSWSITEIPTEARRQQLSDNEMTTDSNGIATSTLTLGNKAGLYKIEASCEGLDGSPIKFTAITGTSFFIKGGKYFAFSIPYRLNNGNAESVFNELGPYDPSQWRLFRFVGDRYIEYPDIQDFSPGLGFWLITSQNKKLSTAGLAVASEVTVNLEPGWNQISCPFTCSVAWVDVKTRNPNLFDNNLVADAIWGYDDSKLELVMSKDMDPWEAYWIYNNSGSNVNLIIPY